jgi:hypothetical protein
MGNIIFGPFYPSISLGIFVLNFIMLIIIFSTNSWLPCKLTDSSNKLKQKLNALMMYTILVFVTAEMVLMTLIHNKSLHLEGIVTLDVATN